MTLSFKANFINCSDALDGEILQVSFDTLSANLDQHDRCSPYLIVSCNFEFDDTATIQWYDGTDCGGGQIVSMRLERDRVLLKLDDGDAFCVTFDVSEEAFAELKVFFRKMIADHVWQK
jgi:hypothetical protein